MESFKNFMWLWWHIARIILGVFITFFLISGAFMISTPIGIISCIVLPSLFLTVLVYL